MITDRTCDELWAYPEIVSQCMCSSTVQWSMARDYTNMGDLLAAHSRAINFANLPRKRRGDLYQKRTLNLHVKFCVPALLWSWFLVVVGVVGSGHELGAARVNKLDLADSRCVLAVQFLVVVVFDLLVIIYRHNNIILYCCLYSVQSVCFAINIIIVAQSSVDQYGHLPSDGWNGLGIHKLCIQGSLFWSRIAMHWRTARLVTGDWPKGATSWCFWPADYDGVEH